MCEVNSEDKTVPFSDHKYNSEKDSEAVIQNKTCPICNKVLPPKSNLSFHIMLHPSDKHFACDLCLHTFKTKGELNNHYYTDHASEFNHNCETCGKVFRHIANLRRHETLSHSDVMRYKCIYCDVFFKEYGQYRTHEAAHDRVTNFQCKICEVYFGRQEALDRHSEKRQCGEKVLKCCQINFVNRMDFVKHTLEKHKKYKQAAQKCKFCGKTFPFQYHKKIHEELCKGEEELDKERFGLAVDGNTIQNKCKVCNREFDTKRGLLRHSKVHSDLVLEKNYTCNICNKKLASCSSLYVHKAIHMNIKKFFCDFCSKGFMCRATMKAHRVVHTKERPFKCRHCERCFPYKGSMLAHERIHTGERPFSCKYCELTFMRYSAKQNHERRHTGEKPYSCSICGKAFLQHSTWKQHERTHSASIECEHCGNQFTTRKEFKLHRRGGQCLNGTTTTTKTPQEVQTVEEMIPIEQVWEASTRMATDANGNMYLYIRN